MNDRSTVSSPIGANPAVGTLPVSAALPAHNPDTRLLSENGIVALGNGPDIRALHMLRGQVIKRATSQGFNLLGVTSVEPEAGKSFVTANLAVALSRISGQQVILLDLDLKRPAIARRFAIEAERGIESWLSGDVDSLATLGQRFRDTGLSIYPAVAQPDGSGDLLSNPRFDQLVGALRQLPKSTLVLCDLPPVFVGDDAMAVIGKLDAYIHVIEEGVTPRRQAQELRAMLEPAICLGAVLNRYSGRWNDSYGYAAAKRYARYYESKS